MKLPMILVESFTAIRKLSRGEMEMTSFGIALRYPVAMAALRFVFMLLLGTAVVQAGDVDYAQRPARGLAIYKEHAFASDSTAVLFEYSSFKAHDQVSYLVTSKGTKLTIPIRGTELLLLPYPGKGEATPQEALAALNYAEERYPTYRDYVKPLKVAWRKEAARPPTELERELEDREKNKESANSFVEWLKGLAPRPEPPKIPPSMLDAPKKAPQTSSTDESEQPELNPLDLKGNLQKIREFYQAAPEVE